MEREKTARSRGVKNTAFTFWDLQEDVAGAVSGHFVPVWVGKRSQKISNNQRETHIMGEFTCDNSSCSKKGWVSGHVAIVIRGYPDNGYNTTVYNQRCITCKRLGDLNIDKGCYVERVAYWLKTWARVKMVRQVYEKKRTPPHLSELCEGCKQGRCTQSL
ncbi:hypothetical protein CPLU01_14758 [Colletotrichum plurivorum]|uniref:3CxxC-type domain-containing protein n=1 Tax=Colletotrichum plurivorum TaxID=2175906 RepID=A0A8H6JHF2_9PEZI|nr:hypothetical protein CPLU01_14758 [Colletotrichum plurivorum]